MSAEFKLLLDEALGAVVHVRFKTARRAVVDYSVVLLVEVGGEFKTVRLYDGAHGKNELHRYTADGIKQPAEVFHRGNLGEGMRAAKRDINNGYRVMIESWQKQ